MQPEWLSIKGDNFVNMASTIFSKCSRLSTAVTCKIYRQPVTLFRFNSNRTGICRTNRGHYVKTYPTMLLLPDGATINIRHNEPRRIIQLPLNLSTLSESERKTKLLRRNPKKKIVIEEEIEDDFDVKSYSHLWKK